VERWLSVATDWDKYSAEAIPKRRKWEATAMKIVLATAFDKGWDICTNIKVEFESGNIYTGLNRFRARGYEFFVWITSFPMSGEVNTIRRLAEDLYPRPLIVISPDPNVDWYHYGKMVSKTLIQSPEEIWDLVDELRKGVEESTE
jgi:hypothetical protein